LAYINFGSRLLKPGLSGTDVEILQCLLNNLPSPISIPITGESNFGPKTEAAVKKFQGYFNLSVDGLVGKNTYLFLGQQTGSYLPSGAPVFGSRNLSKGSSGRDVWVLQNRLSSTKKKYAMAIGAPADSVFGTKTQAAVKMFQKDRGLVEDGVVGPLTFMQLFCNTFMGGRYLQKDRFERNQGYDVYYLQSHLKELGYYSGNLDGKYGIATASAVKALQTAHAIAVDGVVGPQTYYYLADV
jgi:peptidoglycan hydrolase-like protein with peptidoglycan-binding domain